MSDLTAPVRLTRKGRSTRERIVRTAADLIFQQGVAGTSIDDVRRAAGVSGSQMTHYFQDKRSLVRAVVAWRAHSVIGPHRPDLDRLDSFEALDRWADQNVSGQREPSGPAGCRFGSLAGELAESDADTRRDLAAGFVQWEARFRDGLQAMRDRGELRREADPALLAVGILAALQGGMLLTKTTRDVRHLEAALRTTLDHVRSYAAGAATRSGSANREQSDQLGATVSGSAPD
jgi:AcrR family transcriptional regulator